MAHLENQKQLSDLYEEILDDGTVICNLCDGIGKEVGFEAYPCPKCWGAGKLDWIEQIMGKESPFQVSSSSSLTSSTQTSSNTSYNTFQKIKKSKGRNYELKNITGSRTIQRLNKMSNKFKRSMQRRRHS